MGQQINQISLRINPESATYKKFPVFIAEYAGKSLRVCKDTRVGAWFYVDETDLSPFDVFISNESFNSAYERLIESLKAQRPLLPAVSAKMNLYGHTADDIEYEEDGFFYVLTDKGWERYHCITGEEY